jgi:hypothetical protein
LGNYINYTQNQNLMNRLLPRAGGGGAPVNFGGSGSGTFGEGDY